MKYIISSFFTIMINIDPIMNDNLTILFSQVALEQI